MDIKKVINRIEKAILNLDEEDQNYVNEGIRTTELPTIKQSVEACVIEDIEQEVKSNEIDIIMYVLEGYTHYASKQKELNQIYL